MTLSAITESTLNAIETWLKCIVNPFAVLSKISPGKTGLSKQTVELLSCSTVIAAAISWPALRLYGIRWNDFGFQVPNVIGTDLSIMFEGVSLYFMLKLHGIKSVFWGVLEAQVIVAAAYAPAVNLLSIPAEVKRLQFESAEAARHTGISGLVECFYTAGCASTAAAKGPFPYVLSTFSVIVAGVYLVFLAEYLVSNLRAPRERVYSALGSSVVLSFSFWLMTFFPYQLLNEFSAVQRQ